MYDFEKMLEFIVKHEPYVPTHIDYIDDYEYMFDRHDDEGEVEVEVDFVKWLKCYLEKQEEEHKAQQEKRRNLQQQALAKLTNEERDSLGY